MATIDQYQLNDRFLADEGTVFLTGIQALARLPLEQLRTDRLNGLNTASFISRVRPSAATATPLPGRRGWLPNCPLSSNRA